MLVSPSGVRRLETGGVVLGLFDHAAFEEETVTMTPGDLLVTFSDGVTEAMNPAGEEFTDDRLIASIHAHRDKPLAQLVDAALGDVRAFCRSEERRVGKAG